LVFLILKRYTCYAQDLTIRQLSPQMFLRYYCFLLLFIIIVIIIIIIILFIYLFC